MIVGVTGHLGFLHGTSISFVSRTTHSGIGPHVLGLKLRQESAGRYQSNEIKFSVDWWPLSDTY